jgi:hypothetical protein
MMSEKDLELKLNIMKYLWRIGYNVYKNVELTSYINFEKRTFTDIDVLGIKFNSDLTYSVVICDCKSGKVKTAERLFWLSGVMKLFNSSYGLFIRPEMLASNYIDLSNKLNIVPLTNNQMDEFFKSYNIEKSVFFGPFCTEQKNIEQIFMKAKKEAPNYINYILIDYWKDTSQKQILNLISLYNKLIKNQNIQNFDFISSYIYTLMSISVLKFSNTFLIIPEKEREYKTKEYLLGGEVSLKDREIILENFYNFMTNEIQGRYGQKYPISKSDFVSGLTPIYSKYLADLVSRICLNPEQSVLLPRFFSLTTYDSILNNKNINVQNLTMGLPVKELSFKPIKDFITFLERSNIIKIELSQRYKTIITELEKEKTSDLSAYFTINKGNNVRV